MYFKIGIKSSVCKMFEKTRFYISVRLATNRRGQVDPDGAASWGGIGEGGWLTEVGVGAEGGFRGFECGLQGAVAVASGLCLTSRRPHSKLVGLLVDKALALVASREEDLRRRGR